MTPLQLTNTGIIASVSINAGNNTITSGVSTSTQNNAKSYNLSTTVGGTGVSFQYYASGVASMNIGGVDTLAIQNNGTNIMTFNTPGGVIAYTDINVNNNDINNCTSVNSSGVLTLTGSTIVLNGTNGISAVTLASSPLNNNVPTAVATTGYINTVVTTALVQTDFSITGAILANTGGIDNSVSFQGQQPPFEYTTLTAYGVNQLYGSDISFKLSAEPFVWLTFKINVKPFSNFPTGILSGLVMTDSSNASYNMQYSFQATSNPALSPYNLYVYFNVNVYPSLANVADGRTFTFNLQSIPGFK